MSKEFMVLIVPEPDEMSDVDHSSARIFMRFTERPSDDFLRQLADGHPGQRVYCLTGASSWYSAQP